MDSILGAYYGLRNLLGDVIQKLSNEELLDYSHDQVCLYVDISFWIFPLFLVRTLSRYFPLVAVLLYTVFTTQDLVDI